MNHSAAYLETELLTATPQKLRYLLICGALRFARLTVAGWERQEHEAASEALVRCRKIIAELMASVRPDASETARTVLGLYAFLFRTLTMAHLQRDAKQVEDVIRVLQEEEETWRLLCEQLPEAPIDPELDANGPREVTATGEAAILPTDAPRRAIGERSSGGFDSETMGAPRFPSISSPASPAQGFTWNA